jgi:uncharacterized membrane protein
MITAPHLHAMMTHFPIALLMTGFLTEILSLMIKKEFLKHASFYLLILGTLGAIAAYFSGSYAGDGMSDGLLQQPLQLHEDAALITLWLAIITALTSTAVYYFGYQKGLAKWISVLLYVVLIGFVARTGYLGGELVFKHGAGIELELPDFGDQTIE